MRRVRYLVRINKDPDSDWGDPFQIFRGVWQRGERSTLPCGESKARSNSIFAA